MGLRQRLSDLFWPPEMEGEQPDAVTEEAPPAVAMRSEPAPRPTLRQRLQQVGLPDVDPAELERRRTVAAASRDAESSARRAAAYEIVAATCPVPVHSEVLPLPGGLRLRDDEFLVAASSRPLKGHQLTVTTQRLIYTRGPRANAQLVVYLADIRDLAFHDDGTLTVGTPSGRWERLPVAGNNLAASRDGLLEVVHHARAQRSPLPGGLDDLVELRDRGALGAAEYEKRRAAATAAPRRRRQQRQVEVAGRPTARTAAAAATPPPASVPVSAPEEAALAAPPEPAPDAPAQPGEEGR